MTILNWLQQAVQFLVLIPSAMLCYLPMHRQLRFSPKKTALLAAGTLLVYIPAAAWCAAAVERHAMSKKGPETKKAEKSRENTEKSQFYVEFHAKLSEKTQKIA